MILHEIEQLLEPIVEPIMELLRTPAGQVLAILLVFLIMSSLYALLRPIRD